jgi:hypothetical protein
MKQSYRWLILPLFLILLLLIPQTGSAQTKTFYWEQYDVDMTILENGDMRVVETQTLNFAGAPFTFGYGTIPTGRSGNNDGIRDISVSENGAPYRESSSNTPGTFEVERESNEVIINWYFEPALGRRTYTFSYTVRGAVRTGTMEEGSGDQVFWKAIPADHPARIERSTVTIRLPEGIRPQQYTGTDNYLVAGYINGVERSDIAINVSDSGEVITYQATGISTGQAFEVRAQFPHGLLPIETPGWQRQEQRADVIGLAALAVALLILIGGPLLALLLWYMRGRDPELGIVVPEYISEPPDTLPPAVVGALVDERADMQDIVSTLVDLARRGYLTMAEPKKNKHSFQRTNKSADDLRPFERQFLTDIFGGKKERSLDSLRYKFASKLPKLRQLLYEELVSEGLAPRSPESVRNSYGCLGWALLAVGGGAFFLLPAVATGAATAVCPALAIGVTAAAFLVVSRYMPVKTAKGTEAAARWRAFKAYLQNVEKYRNLEEATDIFEQYLGYATAFGLERSWIRKFASVSTTPMPTWYAPHPHYGEVGRSGRSSRTAGKTIPTGGGASVGMPRPTLEGMSGGLSGGLQSMSDGLTRMLTSTSTVLQSTPPSTSSSGGSGGFSGGFSGGSSGGGGSRGFG